MNKYGIVCSATHYLRRLQQGRNRKCTHRLSFLGIDNVLVLRGDSIKSEGSFVPEADGNAYALDLLEQVVSMNHGKYLDEDLQDVAPTTFCIGVAGYSGKNILKHPTCAVT